MAVGKKIEESEVPKQIKSLLLDYHPDIVIITGHDAYYPKKGGIGDIKNYPHTPVYYSSCLPTPRHYLPLIAP